MNIRLARDTPSLYIEFKSQELPAAIKGSRADAVGPPNTELHLIGVVFFAVAGTEDISPKINPETCITAVPQNSPE